MKTDTAHLVTVVSYERQPILYKVCKAKELIRDAEDSIKIIEKWNPQGIFFEPKEQRERIARLNKIIARLRNYARNETINLLTQS